MYADTMVKHSPLNADDTIVEMEDGKLHFHLYTGHGRLYLTMTEEEWNVIAQKADLAIKNPNPAVTDTES